MSDIMLLTYAPAWAVVGEDARSRAFIGNAGEAIGARSYSLVNHLPEVT
jgi:hypothetical protein